MKFLKSIKFRFCEYGIELGTIYFVLSVGWFGFDNWEIGNPKFKNWRRVFILTPILEFCILGWLFWGQRQKDW